MKNEKKHGNNERKHINTGEKWMNNGGREKWRKSASHPQAGLGRLAQRLGENETLF